MRGILKIIRQALRSGIDLHTTELVHAMAHSPEISQQLICTVLVSIGSVQVIVVTSRSAIVLSATLNLLIRKNSPEVKSEVPPGIDIPAKRNIRNGPSLSAQDKLQIGIR